MAIVSNPTRSSVSITASNKHTRDFHISIDENNYYDYLNFKSKGKMKRGVLSRLANLAWANYFREQHEARIRKLKEEGIDTDNIIGDALAKAAEQ